MTEGDSKKNVELTLEDHRQLREMLQDLRDYLKGPRPDIESEDCHSWATRLCLHFLHLHERLVRHFRLEEESGIFDDLAEQFPHASNQLDALIGDHSGILDTIRGITDATMGYSAGKEPDDSRIRRRSHALIDRLTSHEEAETDLMQRLLYEDYGGE